MYANLVKAIANTAAADFSLTEQDRAQAIGAAFSTIHDKYSFNTLQAWDAFIGTLSADDLYEFSVGAYATGNLVWYECQRAVTEALFGIQQ